MNINDSDKKSLLNRTCIGLSLLAMAFASDWVGGVIWSGIILITSFLALREFNQLCKVKNINPSNYLIILIIAAFIITPVFIRSEFIYACQGFLIALSITILLLRMLLRQDHLHTKFADVSASLWSMIYLGFLPSFYVWIRGLDFGFEFVMILVLTVSASDIAAMLIGKFFGKIPLSPQISPNKTLEGSIAGLVFAVFIFYISIKIFGFNVNYETLDRIIPNARFEDILICFFGFLIALISQIGDLLESVFKREVGVKDSGTMLESHGGILDRIDSHLFSVWVGYFIFRYLIV